MSTQISRRLDRLETRLAISDTPRIEAIFVCITRPGPDGPVDDAQAAKLDNGAILHRDTEETLEDFENRIQQRLSPHTGRIPRVILGMPEDFGDAKPVPYR
jgi:hypothetical protein